MLVQERIVFLDPVTVEHVVLRLLHQRAHEAEPVRVAPRRGDFVSVPFRGPPVKSLARVDEVVEGADGFFDGGVAVRAVGIDEVDVVKLEAFETGGEAFDDVFAREAGVVDGVGAKGGAPVDLGGDDQVVTLPSEFLGDSVPLVICGSSSLLPARVMMRTRIS